MKAPGFWQKDNMLAKSLSPLGSLFSFGGKVRQQVVKPGKAGVPVICVGNLVAGGAGKTPVCLAFGAILSSLGMRVHFLCRGYRGSLRETTQVDPAVHTFHQVGDEALLLAQQAPTWVARDRLEGAMAASKGADVIILDDGLQNPSLEKDLSILVVDGSYGYGNGRVMPAGPLRETLESGHRRADSVVMLGEDNLNIEALVHLRFGLAVHKGTLVIERLPEAVRGLPLVAFAGIGRPEKFFSSLKQAGGNVALSMPFADHYPYQERDINRLQKMAKTHGAKLVTTEKDFVRLPAEFQPLVTPVPARVQWNDHPVIVNMLQVGLQRCKTRR